MGGNDYEDDFENDSSSSKKTNPPAAVGVPQQHPMPTAVPITAVAPSYAVPSAPLGSQISAPYSHASQPVPSVPMPTTGSIVPLGAGPSMPVSNVIGTQRPVVPQAYTYSANTPSYPVNAVPSAAVVAQLHTAQLPQPTPQVGYGAPSVVSQAAPQPYTATAPQPYAAYNTPPTSVAPQPQSYSYITPLGAAPTATAALATAPSAPQPSGVPEPPAVSAPIQIQGAASVPQVVPNSAALPPPTYAPSDVLPLGVPSPQPMYTYHTAAPQEYYNSQPVYDAATGQYYIYPTPLGAPTQPQSPVAPVAAPKEEELKTYTVTDPKTGDLMYWFAGVQMVRKAVASKSTKAKPGRADPHIKQHTSKNSFVSSELRVWQSFRDPASPSPMVHASDPARPPSRRPPSSTAVALVSTPVDTMVAQYDEAHGGASSSFTGHDLCTLAFHGAPEDIVKALESIREAAGSHASKDDKDAIVYDQVNQCLVRWRSDGSQGCGVEINKSQACTCRSAHQAAHLQEFVRFK
ncbi:Hypothetical protein, putative [Bodo saltans]|uniref:Uncharacterized protein n=1 Tax=Bodo saltans TaxID=75058 RepID=A0A0S4JTU1_BODSA|nr:Hypothetical protein, putative [Bodo saltans]|eukprot:CUG92538.1 Hypothetical protein, putative [Bodo saltans]